MTGREPASEAGSAPDDARQSQTSHRDPETQRILLDAEHRDKAAEARDVVSNKREKDADLKAFLDTDGSYEGQDARRASAMDRSRAKDDRDASAQDRVELTKEHPSRQPDVPSEE